MISLSLILSLIAADTLEYPIYKLDEIVVTATRTPKLWEDLSLPVTVITNKEIEGVNSKDIGDIFEYGISTKIEKYGGMGASSGILMRGLYSSQVMVLLDGMPINSPSLGGADLSWISGTGIERIEIVRGPISSLYGADALAGVINIITKDNSDKVVKLAYGEHNTLISSMEGGGVLGGFKYSAIGSYRKSDGYRDNSAYEGKDITGKANYLLGKWDFSFYTGLYDGTVGWPGVKPPEDTTKRNLSQLRLGNNEVSSLYDKGSSKHQYLTTAIKFKDLMVTGAINNWLDEAHREWIEFNWSDYSEEHHLSDDNYKTKSHRIEVQDSRRLYNNFLTYGACFSQDRFNVSGEELNREADSVKLNSWAANRGTKSIYLQDEIELMPVRIILGTRWDNCSNYSVQISPKLSCVWKFGEASKLIASYGKGFRAPTLNDLYWPSDPFSEGNPELNPEKGECYEIGLETMYDSKLISRALVFKQDTYDMIRWDAIGPLGPYGNKYIPANINRTQTIGIERELNIEVFNGFRTSLNYSYLITKQRNKELVNIITQELEVRQRKSAYIPEQKIGLGIEYIAGGFRANVDAQYIATTYNYYQDWSNYPEIRMDTKTNPAYLLVRAKFSRELGIANLFLACDNLLNQGYSKFGGTMEDRGYPMPDRAFTLGIALNF